MHPYIAVPAIALLVFRAWSHNSLTPLGIFAAIVTATIHAVHPWPIFFTLLCVFFLGGTATTKVKHHEKSLLTLSSTGPLPAPSPRTHVQVLANSLPASVLILLHYYQLRAHKVPFGCFPYGGPDVLTVGIVANYAAVAADTFSSELGILAKSKPWLITSFPFRRVPPGTNGGVTVWGTLAGLLGASTIAVTSVLLIPFCVTGRRQVGDKLIAGYKGGFDGGKGWGAKELAAWVLVVTLWGGLGSLVDSIFGGLLQESVVDRKTGKVVEGDGGRSVPVRAPGVKGEDDKGGRRVESGRGILDNNGVNLLMATTMSVTAVGAASYLWGISLENLM